MIVCLNSPEPVIFDGLVEAKVIPRDNLNIIQSPVIHYYHKAKKDYFKLRMSDSPEFLILGLQQSAVNDFLTKKADSLCS